jgi:hypothetical protein
MKQSLKSLIKLKEKELDEGIGDEIVGDLMSVEGEFGPWYDKYGKEIDYTNVQYAKLKDFLSQSIQSAYQLAIKDVEKEFLEIFDPQYSGSVKLFLARLQSLLKEKE